MANAATVERFGVHQPRAQGSPGQLLDEFAAGSPAHRGGDRRPIIYQLAG
ncbi:MAG: hypothetical protein ACYCS7_10175 [Acidimicrobiales bacterium]